jgi:glycyl-tRNA synthetase beta chain
MDRELLLEIGCEEIPASWLPGLTNQVGEVVIAQLKEHRLAPEAPAETYSTPAAHGPHREAGRAPDRPKKC